MGRRLQNWQEGSFPTARSAGLQAHMRLVSVACNLKGSSVEARVWAIYRKVFTGLKFMLWALAQVPMHVSLPSAKY